jgi:hypothetical protein
VVLIHADEEDVSVLAQSRRAASFPSAAAGLAGLACLLAAAESVAAPHQLECTVTTRYDMREQRSEMRVLQFVYDDRERTLSYIDNGGQVAKCINGVVGTLEMMGSCGSASVWISRSTYRLELNTFDYRWNQRRGRNEETWSYGEKGSCTEVDAPQQ